MFDISFLIPGFADQRDGQIHISNARSHFFAHPVHAFRSLTNGIGIADPLESTGRWPLVLLDQDKGLQGSREPRSWITTLLRWPAIARPLTTMGQPDRTSNGKWGTGRLRLFFRKMSERKRFCLMLAAGSRITRNVNLLMAGGMTRATVPPCCATRASCHCTVRHRIPDRGFSPRSGRRWAELVTSLPREAEGGSEDVHYPVPGCPWGRPHHRE